MTTAAAPPRITELPWDRKRGSEAMLWFITTEACLFVAFFFSYFFLGRHQPTWPMDEPPKLKLALIMLGVLLTSSGVLEWAKWNLRHGREGMCRIGVGGTMALGVAFLVLQGFEYADHLKKLQPTSDAYGSIFYTITSVHGLHVLLGLLILLYVLTLPRLEPRARLPYHPFHNGSLYWHFIDAVWVFIIILLYLSPRLRGLLP